MAAACRAKGRARTRAGRSLGEDWSRPAASLESHFSIRNLPIFQSSNSAKRISIAASRQHIQRTLDRILIGFHDVQINLGRLDVRMTQQLLDHT